MIIYKNSINGFITDCNKKEIIPIILRELKDRRGIKSVSQKEKESWKTLNKLTPIFNNFLNKEDQYILLEYVIRDSAKRIDVIVAGCDNYLNKNLAIIEMKSWSNIDLYHDTNLLDPHTTYSPCNHPSYEAYDYFYILNNMYDDINFFKLFACSFLPNYKAEKDNLNPLIDQRFKDILQSAECFYINNIDIFKKKLNSLFNSAIDEKEIYRIDNLDYKPSIVLKNV